MFLEDIKNSPRDGLGLLRWGFQFYGFHLRLGFLRKIPDCCGKHDALFVEFKSCALRKPNFVSQSH